MTAPEMSQVAKVKIQYEAVGQQQAMSGIDRLTGLSRGAAGSLTALADQFRTADKDFGAGKGMQNFGTTTRRVLNGASRDVEAFGRNSQASAQRTGTAMGQALATGVGSGISNIGATVTGAFSGARLGQAVKGAGAAVGGVAGAAIIGGIGVAIAAGTATIVASIRGLRGGFEDLVDIDRARAQLRALGTDVKTANSVIESAAKATERTSITAAESTQAAVKALAFGIKPGKDLENYLKMLADMSLFTGRSMDDMSQIMTRVIQSGKVGGRELLALSNAGIPALKFAADAAGVSVEDMRKRLDDTGMSAQQFMQAVQKNLGSASDEMTKTVAGAKGRMREELGGVGVQLFQPLFGDSGNAEANAINAINDQINKLATTLSSHQEEIATFWRVTGRAALTGAKAFTTAFQVIGTAVIGTGQVAGEALGNFTDKMAALSDALGAHGKADMLRGWAKDMHDFGDGARRNLEQSMDSINKAFDKGWKGLDGVTGKASDSTDDLGDSTQAATPKVITLLDAIQKLGDDTKDVGETALKSGKDFDDLTQKLVKAGASDQLLKQVRQLRTEFVNSGASAHTLSDAIRNLSDTSLDASSKASALVSSLEDMGELPGKSERALKSWAEAVRGAVTPADNLTEMLNSASTALINQSGSIDVTSRAGGALFDQVSKLRQSMVEMMAANGNVNETWDQTSEAMHVLLGQFGIFGSQADDLTRKYLATPNTFELLFSVKNQTAATNAIQQIMTQVDAAKKRGDTTMDLKVAVDDDPAEVQKTLESLGAKWQKFDPLTKTATIDASGLNLDAARQFIATASANDPAKMRADIDVTSSQQDIADQVSPPDNPLKIPAVLDVAPPADAGTGAGSGGGPTPRALFAPGKQKMFRAGPMDTGAPAAGFHGFAPDIGKALDTPGTVSGVLGANSDLSDLVKPIVDQAEGQGESISKALADGIRNGSSDVQAAIGQVAKLVADGLGHSPAKYGPLAGSGWSYYRGQTVTTDFAGGVASAPGAVAGAVGQVAGAAAAGFSQGFAPVVAGMTNTANVGIAAAFSGLRSFGGVPGGGGGVMGVGGFPSTFGIGDPTQSGDMAYRGTLDDRVKRSLSDLQSLLGLGQNLFSITQAMGQFAMTIGRLMTVPGGNPAAQGDRVTQGILRLPAAGLGGGGVRPAAGAPGMTGANLSQFLLPGRPQNRREGAQAIIAAAQRAGLTREQTIAALAVAGQESDFGTNPNAYREQNQFGTVVTGPFQQDSSYLRYGNRNDINDAAKGFIDQFIQHGGQSGDPFEAALRVQRPATPANGGYNADILRQNQQQRATDLFNAVMGSAGIPVQANPTTGQLMALPGSYGLPGGTNIGYGAAGFPTWVTDLASQFGLKASTYAGHQESNRPDIGAAPNPNRLNRGIDFSGQIDDMQRFAAAVRDSGAAEQVIFRNPQTGMDTTFPNNVDFSGDLPGHTDHVHLRVSQPIGITSLSGQPAQPAEGQPGNQAVLRSSQSFVQQQQQEAQPHAAAGFSMGGFQGVMAGFSGIGSDVLQTLDQTIKALSATHDLAGRFSRGLANTDDVNKIVDDIQEYITLGARVAQTASDVLGTAAQAAGAGATADPSGGAGGAAAALGLASTLVGAIGQGLIISNAVIDVGQEAGQLIAKYAARNLLQSVGLGGAQGLNFQVDSAGNLITYDPSNPQMRAIVNSGVTAGQNAGTPLAPHVVNQVTVYGGPGQDPRDTMSNAMFSIRSSGMGTFGYVPSR